MKLNLFILLPTHNRRATTLRFIHSLRTQSFKNFQLILIDDGSTDGTVAAVKNEFPETHVLLGNGRWWWAGCLQAGCQYLKSRNPGSEDLLLIINDDTNVSENFLATGVELLLKNPNSLVGAICTDSATGKVLDRGMVFDWRTFSPRAPLETESINCLSTRGLMMRLTDLWKIGTFYPRLLPHYGSDYEFTMRAYRRHFRLVTNPSWKLSTDGKSGGFYELNYSSLSEFMRTFFSPRFYRHPVYRLNFILLACPRGLILKNLRLLFSETIAYLKNFLGHRPLLARLVSLRRQIINAVSRKRD